LEAPHNSANGAPDRGKHEDRLDSWKKIGAYLKRDVSTVQRWERREAMPVHRHQHDKLGSVFAFRSELDSWWEGRHNLLSQDTAGEGDPARAIPWSRLMPGLVGAALLVLLGALTWRALERGYARGDPLANAKFTRLSDFAGTTQAAAISRDGKLVAFLSDRDDRIDVWVSGIGSGTYRNLTHGEVRDLVNPSIRTISFSADSALVSMWTRRPDGSRPEDVNVLAVPIAGGARGSYLPGVAEFDWSRDGKRLVYHTTAPGDPLYVREPGKSPGGSDLRIYVGPAGVHCHFPIWSPDDAFIYFVRGVPPDDWDIWRIRPTGAGLERMTMHSSRVVYPVMLDRRTLLYLATDTDGAGPWIYADDVDRHQSRRISFGLETYTSLAASGDGSRLVATIANSRTSLWRWQLNEDRNAAAVGDRPAPLTPNGETPRIGADFVLYVSSRGERQGIWSQSRGMTREIWGSGRARVIGGPALASDGHRIAFSVRDDERTLLYVMDTDGSHLAVVADSLQLRGNPAWSPDGRSIICAVIRDGEPRLTRIFLSGEPPQRLVSEYSTDPVWSPDGRFLVYSGADVGTTFPLRAAAADGRPYSLPSVMLTRGARRVAFLRNPQQLVILRGEIGHKSFWTLDLGTGAQRPLAELPPDFVVRDFDVAADGSEIVFDRIQVNSDLALIQRAR